MKLTLILCLGILIAWVIVALAQLWFEPIDALLFIKISITAAVLDALILIVGLCCREYFADRDMKKRGYLD